MMQTIAMTSECSNDHGNDDIVVADHGCDHHHIYVDPDYDGTWWKHWWLSWHNVGDHDRDYVDDDHVGTPTTTLRLCLGPQSTCIEPFGEHFVSEYSFITWLMLRAHWHFYCLGGRERVCDLLLWRDSISTVVGGHSRQEKRHHDDVLREAIMGMVGWPAKQEMTTYQVHDSGRTERTDAIPNCMASPVLVMKCLGTSGWKRRGLSQNPNTPKWQRCEIGLLNYDKGFDLIVLYLHL